MKRSLNAATALFAGISCCTAMLPSVTAAAAPKVQSVDGDLSSNGRLTITGSGFGNFQKAPLTLWDTVDNQPNYQKIPTGAEVPTDGGPWTHNGTTWAAPLKLVREGDLRHQYSKASYEGVNKGFIGWPKIFENNSNRTIYVSWWFKPSIDINSAGGHNKLIRVWDAPSGKFTRISWTQILLGAYMPEGSQPDYSGWKGNTGEWNRLELLANSDEGTIKTWTNGELIHSVTNYKKEDTPEGLSIALIGFDPNYADRYSSLVFRMDDIYVSSSPARVEISSSAIWSKTNKNKEIQPKVSWAESEIEVSLNLGQFVEEEDLYLYVINDNGEVNEQGFRICPKCPNKTQLKLE